MTCQLPVGIRLCSVPTTMAALRRPPAEGRSSATRRLRGGLRHRGGDRVVDGGCGRPRWVDGRVGACLALDQSFVPESPKFRFVISLSDLHPNFAKLSLRARVRGPETKHESKCFLGTQSLVVRNPKFA